MKALVALLAVSALIFAGASCAKHDWEETKVLHEGSSEGHGEHGAAEAHEAHNEVHTAPSSEHAPEGAKH
jgi:hypothetical protein